MITQFVLNTVLHHLGLSWIISSKNQMKYDTEENNPDQLNKGLWYNTAICSKLHGTVFEDYIRSTITDRYNLMCSIPARNKLLPTYVDNEISGGGKVIPNNSTIAAL